MKEPIKFKPHHAEGAQRYMAWGKNEGHKIMHEILQKAVDEDADAEMVFVRGFDVFCKRECIKNGEAPPCDVAYGSSAVVSEMDEEVAREHGWEFDRPYKIRDILKELLDEAPDREIFYIHKLTHEDYERWLKNIRRKKQ
jgi:hypothetical protein